MPYASRVNKSNKYADERKNSASRGYDYRWQCFRASYLKSHPLCVLCEAMGIVEPATEVHHIEDFKADYELKYKKSNLMGLCKPCHSKETAKGKYGKTGSEQNATENT